LQKYTKKKTIDFVGRNLLRASKIVDIDLKIILLGHLNNFIGILKMLQKNFDTLATILSVPHNYFDNSTKYFSDPCSAKILHFSVKPFFFRVKYRFENNFVCVIKIMLGCYNFLQYRHQHFLSSSNYS